MLHILPTFNPHPWLGLVSLITKCLPRALKSCISMHHGNVWALLPLQLCLKTLQFWAFLLMNFYQQWSLITCSHEKGYVGNCEKYDAYFGKLCMQDTRGIMRIKENTRGILVKLPFSFRLASSCSHSLKSQTQTAMAIDEVSEALSDLKDRWKASCEDSSAHAQSLRSISGDNAASLPRLNALAQDSLSSLRSLQRKFEILSLQLIRFDSF